MDLKTIFALSIVSHFLVLQTESISSAMSVADSLYMRAAYKDDAELYAEYIRQNSGTILSALAACRLIQIELKKGIFLDSVINTVTKLGVKAVAHRPFSNAQIVVFPDFNFRMILYDNPYVGIGRDPFVEYYIGKNGYIDFDFGALHVLGDQNCYQIKFPNTIFVTVDSADQQFILSSKRILGVILHDFSRALGFSSPEKAFRKLQTLEEQKLTIFVYDIYATSRKYNLKDSGRSFAHGSGFVHLDSHQLDRDDFIKTFTHELSHILLSRGRYNVLHAENRWFDEGFAMWATECFSAINGLDPADDQYLQGKMKAIIERARQRAKTIFRAEMCDYYTFRQINQAWDADEGLYGSSDSYDLSLSILAYIAERYGPAKVVKAAARVSLLGEQLTQKAVEDVLKTRYRELEAGWNGWVRECQ